MDTGCWMLDRTFFLVTRHPSLVTFLKPVPGKHYQGAIMYNLDIVAFEEFIEFGTLRPGIKDYPFWPKRKDIVKDLSLVVWCEIHDHRMHTGDFGLGCDNCDIPDNSGTFSDGDHFVIIADQPAYRPV